MICPAPNCGAPAEASFLSVYCSRRGCINGPPGRDAAAILHDARVAMLAISGLLDFTLKFVQTFGSWSIRVEGPDSELLCSRYPTWDAECVLRPIAVKAIEEFEALPEIERVAT